MNVKTFLDKLGITYLISLFNNLFVHKTKNETINGIKTFNNLHGWNDNSTISCSSIQIQNSLMNRGETQDIDQVYSSVVFLDKSSVVDMNYSSRVATIEIGRFNQTVSGNYGYINLKMYDPTTADGTARSYLQIGYSRNGTPWVACTSTPEETLYNSDNLVLTKNWIPKDTRIVHTTGDETIGGVKTFIGYTREDASGTTGGFVIRNANIVRGTKPSVNQYVSIPLCDASTPEYGSGGNFGRFGLIETCVRTTGDIETYIATYKNEMGNTSGVSLLVGYPLSGNTYVKANTNNTTLLGNSSNKWKEIWCGQSSINSSSDERLKDNIKDISNDILDVWEDVHWNQFQFKDAMQEKGSNARIHSGLVAQHIDTIFKNHNLDVNDYGFFLYDSWDATEEEKDENGNIIKEAIPAGDSYGLRYTECLAIEAAYLRRKIRQLEEKNKTLENTITSLIARIEALENK